MSNLIKNYALQKLYENINKWRDPVSRQMKTSATGMSAGSDGVYNISVQVPLPYTNSTNAIQYLTYTSVARPYTYKINITNTDPSFEDIDTAMGILVRAAERDFARMLVGNGSGALAAVVSNNGNVVSIDDNARFVYIGLYIDIYDGDTAVVTNKIITAEGEDSDGNPTITIDGVSGTLTNTSKVYLAGRKGAEMTGMGSLVDDSISNIWGLSKVSNKPFVTAYKTNVSGTVSVSEMQRAIGKVSNKYSKLSDKFAVICSPGVFRALRGYLNDNCYVYRRETRYGFDTIICEFLGEYPIFSSPGCAAGTMYIVDTKLCEYKALSDWNLDITTNSSSTTISISKTAEFICTNPNCGVAVLTSITES